MNSLRHDRSSQSEANVTFFSDLALCRAYLCLCRTRADVFRMIPDVRRNLAISAFENLIQEVREDRYCGALEVSFENISNTQGFIGNYATPVITPKGAHLFLRMLGEGLIPQKSGTTSLRHAPALELYAASEQELMRSAAEQVARDPDEVRKEQEAERAAHIARIEHLAAHPEDARPDEIRRSIIDRVFIAKYGYGTGGTLMLGGLECHKELHHWTSNRGSRNVDVIVWWTDADGKRRGDKPFKPHINRRWRGENIHKYERSLREIQDE